MLSPLPIDDVLPQLLSHLHESASVVLRAPTGAGKTTRVPPALLDAGLAGSGQVVMLEPRRLAARAAAARMASERGSKLGAEVGYHVRFERCSSRDTQILTVTDGLFVRMLQDDPYLERVGVVVFDEFHERSIQTDLALAMVRRVQQDLRPELKIVVMSATLAAIPIAAYLDNCPTVESQGRLHSVQVTYQKHERAAPLHVEAARGVATALDATAGDLLVFLPGVGEIRRTARELESLAEERGFVLMELYGDLPLERQQAVLERAARRKVVLTTNVAETSVTIDGITGVVDTGMARVLRMDSAMGLDRLELTRISRASADQRIGRAGRSAPGICLRLWTEAQHRALDEQLSPEIERVDLASAVLELLSWGESDLVGFPWFEPPPPHAIERALVLLERLGATRDRQLTPLGRTLARLPVHPRIARLLVAGAQFGHADRAALAAALLSERDPFLESGGHRSRSVPQHASQSDVLERVLAIEAFERTGRRDSDFGRIDFGAVRFMLRARDQLLRLVEQELPKPPRNDSISADEALLRSLLAAYPDRLARRREPSGRRAVMLGGRGVRLADESAVLDAELFVCVEIEEIGKSDSLARQVSAVRSEWLPPDRLTSGVDVEFDPVRERVVAMYRTRFEDLVLSEAVTSVPPNFDAAALLASEAAGRLDRLKLDDEAANFLARVRCLASWMPELELPALGENPLAEVLPQLCQGCLSFNDVRKAPVVAALKSLLRPDQLAAVEREAPARLRVPSGSQIALAYEFGQPPVLAVRIQELFGMKQTPRVAGGRVGVLLHLLAPNMRPQQVTADLPSFWANTYPVVRKELRRRYPKHSWPEDPTTAEPQRRPGKKPGANS